MYLKPYRQKKKSLKYNYSELYKSICSSAQLKRNIKLLRWSDTKCVAEQAARYIEGMDLLRWILSHQYRTKTSFTHLVMVQEVQMKVEIRVMNNSQRSVYRNGSLDICSGKTPNLSPNDF